jgi:hypothetical protein
LTWEQIGFYEKNHPFQVPDEVSRARVPGGWLVWAVGGGMAERSGLVFVPDPDGTWGKAKG